MRNRVSAPGSFQVFFQRVFLNEKLNNWVGVLIVLIIATAFGYLISDHLVLGLAVFAGLIGFCVLLACILNTELGLYINVIYAFSAAGISRFLFDDNMPVGVITEILLFATFLGLFISNDHLKKNSNRFFKIRPVIYYTVIVGYLTLELFNPLGHSFEGWLQVMRKVFEGFVMVFLAYNVLDTLPKIRKFIKILFCLLVLTALYGCFQQWHGLLPVELYWVHKDEVRFGLIFVFGEYRKFSVLGDPTNFGIIMAACSLFYIIISLNEKNRLKKYSFLLGSVIMLLGMAYSGTRTANAMVVGGLAIFLLLTINKLSSKLFACFAVLLFLFLMYVPIYSSITLIRFRSTFQAKDDGSYIVREENRRGIQPFVLSHPFGGGLSTTGEMGKKYNPGHPVAGFPTDSSYLNKALESGWVGLIMTLMLYLAILQYIIRGYFLTDEPELKKYFAGALAFFFSFFLGEITQEAVGLFTNMGVYFPVLAAVLRLRQFTDEKQMLVANT